LRLALEPCQRPDPTPGQTWGGRTVARNGDAYKAWLEHATLLMRTSWGRRAKLSPGPVQLEVVFIVRPPKREVAKLSGLFCARRPDLDRYVHAIQDAITQAGNIWDDDGQVARVDAAKRYCHEGEPVGIVVECSSLPLTGPTWENRGAGTGAAAAERPVTGEAADGRSVTGHRPAPLKGAFR
jgi:Holliday junction resolvase RusA-like endonuclease